MLHSTKQLLGKKLGTSEGEIGHVKDFYFDDQNWVVRYVVANTASWLTGRLVLLSPHAFGSFLQDDDCLFVNLTREQIKNSPAIELHKPVSRQYEEQYYRYYGWPAYWEGNGIGMGYGFPEVPPLMMNPSLQQNNEILRDENVDPHLRSTKALNGYHIHTSDGTIGHVTDFIMDDKSWEIRHIIVKTGGWFSGKEIAISPKMIDRISYEESSVFVNLTMKSILEAPEYHVPAIGEVLQNTRNFNE